ncbi:MAG: glycosyl transferase family 2 [Gemmatimonadetes bacterium]|nr:glycosyl transferase family 2 [Gemmatimonadota bacterium]
MTPTRISVCLIVRDEEAFLPACLNSVRGVAAEVVVVDTGSIDSTVRIARDAGCVVIHRAWTDDYAAARNAGIDAAAGDWILCLDADERLVTPDALAALLADVPAEVGGFLVERHDVVAHASTGRTDRYPVGIVRLFRRHPGIRYVGAVHERPGDTILAAGFSIARAPHVRIAHLVSGRPDEVLRAKQGRYLRLLERETARDPGDFWAAYYRAKTLWYLGRHADAEAGFLAIADAVRCAAPMRASALAMLGALCNELGRHAEGLSYLDWSLKVFPLQSLAAYLRGEILYAAGDYARAAEAYAGVGSALDGGEPREWLPGDLYLAAEKRAYKLGCCALAAGDLSAALAHFRAGLEADGEDAACWLGCAHVAAASGDRPLARALAEGAAERDPGWRLPGALLSALEDGPVEVAGGRSDGGLVGGSEASR